MRKQQNIITKNLKNIFFCSELDSLILEIVMILQNTRVTIVTPVFVFNSCYSLFYQNESFLYLSPSIYNSCLPIPFPYLPYTHLLNFIVVKYLGANRVF